LLRGTKDPLFRENPGWFAIIVRYPWHIRENIDLGYAFVQLHQDLGCTMI